MKKNQWVLDMVFLRGFHYTYKNNKIINNYNRYD